MDTKAGAFHWNELMTSDLERSKAYYAAVCGWTYQEMPMDEGFVYTLIMSGDQPVGGMMATQAMGEPDHPEYWIGYVAVDDCDGAAEAAGKDGGAVLQAPFDVGGVGRIAIIQDPSGCVMGVIKPAPMPGA